MIREASLAFSRFNVLIGPNGSGKSSILHAINALRTSISLLRSPIEPRLFLGGIDRNNYAYSDIVYLHDVSRCILLKARGSISLLKELDLCYDLALEVALNRGGRSHIELHMNGMEIWKVEPKTPRDVSLGPSKFKLDGYEIEISGSVENPLIELYKDGNLLLKSYLDDLIDKYIYYCPILRGSIGQEVYVGQHGWSFLEPIASKPELKATWNKILTEVLGYNSYVDISGIGQNRLSLSNVTVGVNVALEAFSMNQLLYVMPLMFSIPESATLTIEEPEIHLHPAAQARLTENLVKIAKERNLQLILSTHSEHILLRFLTLVREGALSPNELKVYYFERSKETPIRTLIEELKVNERGELDKGLKGFFEAELEEFSRFVKAKSSH